MTNHCLQVKVPHLKSKENRREPYIENRGTTLGLAMVRMLFSIIISLITNLKVFKIFKYYHLLTTNFTYYHIRKFNHDDR